MFHIRLTIIPLDAWIMRLALPNNSITGLDLASHTLRQITIYAQVVCHVNPQKMAKMYLNLDINSFFLLGPKMYIWKIYIFLFLAMVHTLGVPQNSSNSPPIETLVLYMSSYN